MERPPSLNNYLDGREETSELFKEWETLLSEYRRYVGTLVESTVELEEVEVIGSAYDTT